MNHQFKKGDLALIINHTFPPAIGCCVELVSRHIVGPVDRRNPMDPGVYEQEEGEAAWVVAELDGQSDCIVWEKWIMPLLGDTAPAIQKSQAVPV
jgi:oxalate decarboxylase/phosphoglucose isomerase-like protein (cupin superfamily)